eukprot:1152496-Pelagomonas_calceolata.AAC.1
MQPGTGRSSHPAVQVPTSPGCTWWVVLKMAQTNAPVLRLIFRLQVILFCLIVALCSFGIVHATNASYKLEGQQARDAAVSAADGIAMQLSSASRAALSLAAVVKMNPNWSFLESNFQVLAEELFRQVLLLVFPVLAGDHPAAQQKEWSNVQNRQQIRDVALYSKIALYGAVLKRYDSPKTPLAGQTSALDSTGWWGSVHNIPCKK